MLQILIVEDDPSFALELEMLVQDIGYQVAGVVGNSGDALDLIYSQKIDFILMDIEIEGKLTGLELGKKIRPFKTPILFITSYGDEEHYEEAQKSNISGYLVKPIDQYTLRTAINLAISNQYLGKGDHSHAENGADTFFSNQHLFIKKDKVYHKVAESEIAYLESADDYVIIKLLDMRSFLVRKTLQAMERMLASEHFTRVHRSFLVNLNAIQSIDSISSDLIIADKTIPISRQRKAELDKLIRKVE